MTKNQAEKILEILAASYGTRPWNSHPRQSPFQVLIATVLSQRTRDENTDNAARALFSRYPSPELLASAPVERVAELIKPVNYYNTKALRIKEISRIIQERHAGATPESLAELTRLPGVGRKTAACVLVYGFGKPALPVDTHVHRVANRLGLVATRTPAQTETELWNLLPEKYIVFCNELLVKHGQSICRPLSPRCGDCALAQVCDSRAEARKDNAPRPGDKIR